MKIVLFMDSPIMQSGYGYTCRLTAKELISRGYEVYTIAFNGGPQENKVIEWYGLKVLPNDALNRNQSAGNGDAETVRKIFREINPDILFFHNDSYRYSYMNELSEEILSRSVFWLPFEGETADEGGMPIFKKCAATRFVTEYALNFHKEPMAGFDIGVIPHAVDVPLLPICADKRAVKRKKVFEIVDGKVVQFDSKKTQGKAPKAFSLEKKFVVTRVDRHQPRKYWNMTMEAFAKFAKGKDDVILLAKCHPRDMSMFNDNTKVGMDLEAMAANLGIRDKIFFDDYFFATEEMPQAFYHPADVFLTTTSGEGFGLATVEAMSCGLPVICPDVPVLPEVLGGAARFCKVAGRDWYDPLQIYYNRVDSGDVAAKLDDAYNDWKNNGSAELSAAGAIGRAKAESMYSPKAVYDAWDEVFKKVVERKDFVSVITVLYNLTGAEQLTGDDGVDKLRSSMAANVKHPHEWIIVDNGSPAREETREWMKKTASENQSVRLVFLDENRGFAGGNNAAIATATGKWVVLANPDGEALNHGDWLAGMVAVGQKDASIGIVGMELMRRDDIMTGAEFPYFCNVMISKKCLDAVRLGEDKWFDEAFWPAYYEDCDLTLRALSKNFKVVADKTIAFWHKSGGTNKFAIQGGAEGQYAPAMLGALESAAKAFPDMADFKRKREEMSEGGMQRLIQGNIEYLNKKWGVEARKGIKVVWQTHIGAAVGFSQIAEGLIPQLHELGFDVYVNDWSNGAKVEDPLIAELIAKTRKALVDGVDLSAAINIVCWLMDSFHSIDADFKVGTAFCESTRIRPYYQQFCNSMDRILTFSEFCRGVQRNSGFTVPIEVLPPGVHPIFMNHYDRNKRDKFRFLAVGVAQDRKDTKRLVAAFCEAFPKDKAFPPECNANFPYKCSDVELLVKSNHFGDLSWIQSEGWDKKANVKTLFTGDEKGASRQNLSMQEMYDLYCDADCLVHPSHGEGIGMPVLEAAATGMPVIFTNWSSPSEYLDESNSYPCSLSSYPGTTFTTAYLGHGNDGENGDWANVHIGHMKFLMYQVVEDHDKAMEKGRAASKHIADNFNWAKTARLMMPLIFGWEEERKLKEAKETFDPMTYEKPEMEPIQPTDRVMIDVCSRDRHSYLSGLIVSLLGQTFKNWDMIIQCDDADDSMPYDHQINRLCARARHEGHNCSIIRSYRQGPHIAHDRTLRMTLDDKSHNYALICRIDDDIYVRPDFLQNLFDLYVADKNCEIGAISGVYIDPARTDQEQMAPKGYETSIEYAGAIDHNRPWPYICLYPPGTPPRPVEHLYSSFMYRTEVAQSIGGYCRLFSQIGHREESDFSYRFHLAGYKLLIEPKSVGFHFAAPAGGIRSESIGSMPSKQQLAAGDDSVYLRRLKRWKQRLKAKEDLKNQGQPMSLPAPIAPEMANAALSALKARLAPRATKPVSKPKVIVLMSAGDDAQRAEAGVEYFAQFGDVYVMFAQGKANEARFPKAKMVAKTNEEEALLATTIFSEGAHEYVMNVSDRMRFEGDPTTLLSPDYDDYVFEIFETYVPGRSQNDSLGGKTFTRDDSIGVTIGPELDNNCLMFRRRPDAKPVKNKIMYSDMMVVNDVENMPVNGKSIHGNGLVLLSDIDRMSWRKVVRYQYPEGALLVPTIIESAPNKVTVSIIIPTHGRKDWLKRCVDSIYTYTSTSFEIIVIDNGSDDGTAQYLEYESKARKNLRHFRQAINHGYQKAINLGLGQARGEYVLLFNDDAEVYAAEPDGRDWIQVLIDGLKANPKAGVIGPHEGESPALKKKILFFWCVLMEKATIDKIGPLDDKTFRNYGGDDDYCERLRRAGYEIVTSQYVHLKHAMNLVPDGLKKPELLDSEAKLKAKWAVA